MGFQTKPSPLSVAQRKLWQRLNDYIRQEGGWTVSEPNVSPIRFECPTDSSLPELLREAGHDVRDAGTSERLMPTSNIVKQHGGITTVTVQNIVPTMVEVFEFKLPFG
jgi:hypothetical protein